MAILRWLHLSDFHVRASVPWAQDVVLKSLVDDIRDRYCAHPSVDLLFITGDVAFSGKSEEYRIADEFIRSLQAALSIPADRLFIVAGNHDIDRTLEEDAFRGARLGLSDTDAVDRFFNNEGRRRTLFRRQAAFREFVNHLAPPAPLPYSNVSFSHWKQTRVGPLSVVGLLLDSSWLSEGSDADVGQLIVGERQVIDSHASCPKDGLIFGLTHHPFAWLQQFEQLPIENLLLDRVQIMLRGHVHAADLRAVEALERRLNFFTAGATFAGRTADNSYGYAVLDLLTGEGTLTTHRYIHAKNHWEPNVPQTWRLLDRTKPRVPLTEALAFCHRDGGPFPNYRALLLSGHVTEVPRYLGGVYLELNFDLDLEGDPEPLAPTIYAVRHLVHWRQIWERTAWQSQLDRLLYEFNEKLGHLSSIKEAAEFLKARESKCEAVTSGIVGESGRSGPILDEVTHLLSAGEFSLALSLLRRSDTSNVLTSSEKRLAAELEVVALLRLNNTEDAINAVTAILANEPTALEPLFLAAQCYYDIRRFSDAGIHMHKALDAGIDVGRARRLALLIAGQTGDADLRKRVEVQ